VAGQLLFHFKTSESPMIDLPLLRSIGKKQVVTKEIRQEVLEAVY
jgi:hypothetical protein